MAIIGNLVTSKVPKAVEVKSNTGNEAVPTGDYWKVTAKVFPNSSFGPTAGQISEFFINDVAALRMEGFNNRDNNVGSTAVVLAPVDYPRRVSFMCLANGTSNFVVRYGGGGTYELIAQGGSGKYEGVLPPNAEIAYTQGDTNSIYSVSAWELGDMKEAEFIVPAGTNLRVSGRANYTVSKYAI